ncbi:hypothetical protein AB0M95_35355 [Sphaerisporangium sp. NPDC051017]|uniref:hypothetical protein n=1 Tax=Sphaerisporangium sp. NPDC051017 TaxID=3154636 RepID=UPI003426A67F
MLRTPLREFALLVAAEDPSVTCVADLQRRHVERYRGWLLERPAARGGPLHRYTVRDRLSKLRSFFRRLDGWDAEDRPARQLVFDSDFPIADEPLPRFLDDAAAAKLLAAARQDPDPFVRLVIESLEEVNAAFAGWLPIRRAQRHRTHGQIIAERAHTDRAALGPLPWAGRAVRSWVPRSPVYWALSRNRWWR